MWSRNDVGSSISTFFINCFHIRAKFCFFPAILMSSTYTDKNNFCFLWTNTHFPKLVLFPIQVPSMLFRTVFPTRALRVGVRINFVQDEQQDLQDIPYDFGHLCSGRRIRTSGHFEFFFEKIWASSIFTWVYADTASAACPSQSGSRLRLCTAKSRKCIWCHWRPYRAVLPTCT